MAKIQTVDKTKADFNDIMEVSQNAIMSRLNCHSVGKVIEFDKTTQTATIQLMQLKQFANEIYTPAPLTEVPLIIYGNEQSGITLPDPTGTICLIFFLDRNIDNFIQTGEMYQPETSRMHDYTDCIAITTFKTLVNPIEDYDENSLTLYHNRIIEEIAYSAIIKNYANKIYLNTTDKTSNATLDMEITNIENVSNAIINLTATNGVNTSVISLDNLITIQNSAQNLGNLIQTLIETIKSITILNNAISKTSKDALSAVASNFALLLKGIE